MLLNEGCDTFQITKPEKKKRKNLGSQFITTVTISYSTRHGRTKWGLSWLGIRALSFIFRVALTKYTFLSFQNTWSNWRCKAIVSDVPHEPGSILLSFNPPEKHHSSVTTHIHLHIHTLWGQTKHMPFSSGWENFLVPSSWGNSQELNILYHFTQCRWYFVTCDDVRDAVLHHPWTGFL